MKSPKSAKIWIINPFTNKVMQVDESDPRIAEKRDTDLAWFKFAEHPSLEYLRRWHRRAAHDAYRYAEWGSTEEELCDRYNKRFEDAIKRMRSQIKDLEVQIEDAESRKIKPSRKRP